MAIFTDEMGDKKLISTIPTQLIEHYIILLNNKVKTGILDFTQKRSNRLRDSRGITIIQDYDRDFIVNNCSWACYGIRKALMALNKELTKRKLKEAKNVHVKKVGRKPKTVSAPSKPHRAGIKRKVSV
jgi:hypothetical protein